jgi:hypothetical protein
MVGWPAASWHLELVGDRQSSSAARPTDEDLLVIYTGRQVDEQLVARLITYGGTQVISSNPYWERWGVTVQDPDGYRLVLSTRSWP